MQLSQRFFLDYSDFSTSKVLHIEVQGRIFLM